MLLRRDLPLASPCRLARSSKCWAAPEFKADDCRWPIADFDRGEFLFCGDSIAEPYIAPGVVITHPLRVGRVADSRFG